MLLWLLLLLRPWSLLLCHDAVRVFRFGVAVCGVVCVAAASAAVVVRVLPLPKSCRSWVDGLVLVVPLVPGMMLDAGGGMLGASGSMAVFLCGAVAVTETAAESAVGVTNGDRQRSSRGVAVAVVLSRKKRSVMTDTVL